MQLQLKFVRLDLTYNEPAANIYRSERFYLSAQPGESAEHFVRRLLSLILLFPKRPQLNQQSTASKIPDLFVAGNDHLRLWCQVDLPSAKLLHKACHQADEVWLMLTEQQAGLWQHTHKIELSMQHKVHLLMLADQQVNQACEMLKPHMALSAWREPELLWFTDGDCLLELPLHGQGEYLH